MKLLSKLFSLGLTGVAASPTFIGINNNNTKSNEVIDITNHNEETEENMRCTIAYVGKECTADHLAIIARSNDSTPRASNSYLKRVKHNEMANVTIKNEFGFEYTFPKETYAYISSPDGWKSNPKEERHLWHSMGINEMGVGITCTLTCYTNEIAQKEDDFYPSGIAEEAFNQILAASANSARNAMEIAAQLVKTYGSQDANIIMATDQNETWLMELYTGKQYCAVKLPDDMAFVAGNEFILNTLDELGINADNEKERCIHSDDLWNLPNDKGFIQYDGSGTQDIYHMHLFNTYAGVKAQGEMGNGSHMRTWRGYSLWNSGDTTYAKYDVKTKYPPMFKPTHKDGTLWTDMTIYDVINVYRDEYDDILADTSNPNYAIFKELKDAGTLRTIPTETARLVHIITSNPDLPKEMAVNALYCPSSANYTPFILLNNGINDFTNDEYTYCPQRCEYDEKNASVLFRKLNSLAWPHREKYGMPLQKFWSAFETINITQMQQVMDDANKLNDVSKARDIITNFNTYLRERYIYTVKYVTQDLIWHDMNQDHRTEASINAFEPLVDLEQYLTQLGGTGFNKSGNVVTFKYKDLDGKLELGEGYTEELGKITIGDYSDDITVNVKNNKAYVSFEGLNKAIGSDIQIIKININDFVTKNKYLGIILTVTGLAIVIATSITLPLVLSKKKKTKIATK